MTSRKITEGGRVGGKKNKTVQYKISGVRLRWKMTWNETQNSRSLILEGVCCVWIGLGKQTSRLTEITALILCARVIKALGSRLKSFTLQLTGFVLDCSSSTPWLHFVYSRLVCLRPIEIFKLYVYLHCLLTICVSGQEEPPRRIFTDQVKWTMISKVKYFLETFPVFGSYVLTPSIWKWMFISGALYIFPCFWYRQFVVISKLQSSLVTFCLFIACPSNCVMNLWPKFT